MSAAAEAYHFLASQKTIEDPIAAARAALDRHAWHEALELPGEAALACAVAIQRSLAYRRSHGFAPQVRIGVHAAEATSRTGDYGGRGVHQAARIGALAEGGEILASEETLGSGDGSLTASEARAVRLKGLSEPVRVVAIDWR